MRSGRATGPAGPRARGTVTGCPLRPVRPPRQRPEHGPGAGVHVRPSRGPPSPRPPLDFVDLPTRSRGCPQLRPPPVFIFFSLRRDLKAVAVVSGVDCVDRARSRRSERSRACGEPVWRTCGQIGPSVDGFGGPRIRPQRGPVVPTVVPRCAAFRPQGLGVRGGVRIALPSDRAVLCTQCGQPVESAWTRVWIPCGSPVGGMWTESGSSLMGDPLALWAIRPHHGETRLCINDFDEFCEARVRGFAASRAYGYFGQSKDDQGASTVRGRPEVVGR